MILWFYDGVEAVGTFERVGRCAWLRFLFSKSNHRNTESQNHSGWRHLWRSVPAPFPKQVQLELEQVAQNHGQLGFQYLQGWRLHNITHHKHTPVAVFSHIRSKCIFLSLHWISCTSVCAHCLALDKARTSLDLTLCPPTRHWHAHWYDPAEPPPGWAVPDLPASPHTTGTLSSPLPCSGLIIGYPYVSSAGEPITGPSSPDVSGWCWVHGKDHPPW